MQSTKAGNPDRISPVKSGNWFFLVVDFLAGF
jgi:hypothetical protein